MSEKKFQKHIEDFTCAHCGAEVVGSGYTNHCPKCLWSKHVDRNPGDRAERCCGMMEPVRLEGTTPSYRIVHRCVSCKALHRNDVAKNDSSDAIVEVAARAARAENK